MLETNPLLVVAMGDRIITERVFELVCSTHLKGGREAALTFLTAIHDPPANKGKGRILRDPEGKVTRIVEQRDIDAVPEESTRAMLDGILECNCPLYVIRSTVLYPVLKELTNSNAQRQYYLTDVIAALAERGGELRTVTITSADPDYPLLAADVTRPEDIKTLESAHAKAMTKGGCCTELAEAAETICRNRPFAQVAALARQIQEAFDTAKHEGFGFKPDWPVAIGMSGGRFRIAFMHPDMARFYGPAWQMTIGPETPHGNEQILVIAQCSGDTYIHLFPTNEKYRYRAASIPGLAPEMFPDSSTQDFHSYEAFGTRLSETLLVRLGYVTDAELERMRVQGKPLPPPSKWASANMRDPVPLVCNAIASIRTLRAIPFADRIEQALGHRSFPGLRIICAGDIPQGGFASSSAVTVAAQNAVNALFDLRIPEDLLVTLACQAEYGTGVRAGSLDQATEQKGLAGVGALISSNPRDGYRVLATYPVPAHRFKVLFVYTVERDLEAWRWSRGFYGKAPGDAKLTTGEVRKLTGKAAEMAAILVRLPLELDFFKQIEQDLIEDGRLSLESRRWITNILRALPLLISKDELRERILESRDWYVAQLRETLNVPLAEACLRADATLSALFSGWRNPSLPRSIVNPDESIESGVPLRTMVAYLFAEVARNFRLIHEPDQWIYWVTWSQRGDRCVEIDPNCLPDADKLTQTFEWERKFSGPDLLDEWLLRCRARYSDYNEGLHDDELDPAHPPEIEFLKGARFFRGLALIDLAEAMLKRAFGLDAVAVRVNGAGQGDYFQVHVDAEKVDVEAVKNFVREAFYRRFDLRPHPEFVEVHPGGGAFGVRLSRYDELPALTGELMRRAQL
ncbi:MAG: hypothetical protein N3G20_02160 [Verrucomicrobiae bacterium]|nr:hypothetical protein [Verrucomicrobiae bacterium]